MKALAALLLLGVLANQPWEFPFGPFKDPGEPERAAADWRRFDGDRGASLAMRAVCGGDADHRWVDRIVAANSLIARADRAYPRLLDALARREDGGDESMDAQCAGDLEGIVRFGVCYGYDVLTAGPDVDTDPLAIERRAGTRRALVRAIAAGGRRGERALDVLLEAGIGEGSRCTGLPEAMHDATAALVARLGAPAPPLKIPRGAHSATARWERALRALATRGVDRAQAEAPVRALLRDDQTAPLAALALVRMGADATDAVPALARILAGNDRYRGWWRPDGEARLTQLSDTVTALSEIGPAARAALPDFATFLTEGGPAVCNTVGLRRYVDLVRAIATPADAQAAAAALAPLLRCEGPVTDVVAALAALGPAARDALLWLLRDEGRRIDERLAAAHALAGLGAPPLDEADRRLAARLEGKRAAGEGLRGVYKTNRAATAAGELARCRAEAGLESLPPPPGRVPGELGSCLGRYLCGPAPETYLETMERCCREQFRYQQPEMCLDLRPPTVAAPPLRPTR
jgi:hypothetical protein